MKKNLILTLSAVIMIAITPVFSQNKVAVTDYAQVLNADVESLLSNRLQSDSLELTMMIDTRNRCNYWFVSLIKQSDDLLLSVMDCKDKSAGSKNLGSKIFTATDSEKALLIHFALSEIISEPYTKNVSETKVVQETVTANKDESESPVSNPGQHKTRYFFAPSSYNLEKGELYYNSLYFFVHDVQYGISNNFSIGMGTTIMGFPFYLTPKITIPVNDKSSFAVGDMLMLGTWGTNFSGNLLYATYTRGGVYNNFTLGGGYLHTGNGEITNTTNSPVFNFSSLLQVSSHIYFITENYSSLIKTKKTATYNYYNPNPPYNYTYYSEEFEQKMFFIYGLTGFRFINKNKDVRSWQFGLSYIFSSFSDMPVKYSGTYWYTGAKNGSNFIAFPVIGYARKFATKY